jgi:hypothetical protein
LKQGYLDLDDMRNLFTAMSTSRTCGMSSNE